jgi:hypothetical protein
MLSSTGVASVAIPVFFRLKESAERPLSRTMIDEWQRRQA